MSDAGHHEPTGTGAETDLAVGTVSDDLFPDDLFSDLPAGARDTDDEPSAVVEVRRSKRRRRTVSAYREAGRTVVLIPASFSKAEEREWVAKMVGRLDSRTTGRRSDQELLARAGELSRRYLQGAAVPRSVSWVDNQNSRWGSCTPVDASIRLSNRLATMPTWVSDYVLLHELAHLIEPNHSARFWQLLQAYPRTERARGYLEGFAAAAHR